VRSRRSGFTDTSATASGSARHGGTEAVRPSVPRAADACWEVTDIVVRPDRLTDLRGSELDEPDFGRRGNAHAIDISGWVLGRSVAATTLQIVHCGRVIRVVPLSGSKPDIAERHPDAPGVESCRFYAPVGLLGLGLKCKLSLLATLADGKWVPLGSIHLRRKPVRSGFEPEIQPLLVTCLGRSGSTWLMRLLGAHPSVVIYDAYPYEHRLAAYWLHMLKVLSEPADRKESADRSFQANARWIGQNPFNDAISWKYPPLREWLGRDYVERLAAFCQGNIDQWYGCLVNESGPEANRDRPLFFAEKFPPSPEQNVVRELYPKAKEVILVRDFRDMACSIFAFDKKRGFFGFGREQGDTDHDYMRILEFSARDLYTGWQERKDWAHVVRYEDLVLRPRETLTSLLDYVGLDASPSVVDLLLAATSEGELGNDSYEVRLHQTSPDAPSSVGRWRRDLDEPLKARCQQLFGDLLEAFGYPESGYMAESQDRDATPAP
jgi:hypothetical protein